MIDYFDDIFFRIRDAARTASASVEVSEEFESRPTSFPHVAVSETNNASYSLDSSQREKYAAIQLRIRVSSNRDVGKRKEAMAIFQAIDRMLTSSNFVRRSKSNKPDLYLSSVYEITAIYEAVLGEDGQVYTRR